MFEALIVTVLLVGAAALWVMLRASRRLGSAPPRNPQRPVPAVAPRPVASAAEMGPFRPLPDHPLLLRHETLPADRRQALLERLRQIPRPPRALQQMVSPEFLAQASSQQLADLVMSEPLVAARTIAAVNAPLYGLRKPVTSVGQAITFLGLNTVRSLTLQHLLREAMPTTDPRLRQELAVLWKSSAIASELFLLLAKRLQLPDAPAMSTQLVLHFLGRVAAAALLPRQPPAANAPVGMQARAMAEQQLLSLSAGEIGTLLMQEWGLPAAMIDPTRDIARIVFTAAPAPDGRYAARLALCAMCDSWAERIARRELVALQDYHPEQDEHEDMVALAPHLAPAMLAGLGEALREADLSRLVRA